MAFYAYCLLRMTSEENWPGLEGIGAHPVFPLRSGKFAMLLSRLERDFPFTPRSIVEHGQVIAKAFETHTVLPLRFGTFFRSERQVTNMIQENQQELTEAFCRLRGKAEMRLKLMFMPESMEAMAAKPCRNSVATKFGCAEGSDTPLDARNQELAHRVAARFGEMFRPLEQQISCRLVRSQEMVLDCAHLVETQKVESYQKLQAAASEQMKNCDLRISGPWPPYHFLPTSVRIPAASAVAIRRRVAVGAR